MLQIVNKNITTLFYFHCLSCSQFHICILFNLQMENPNKNCHGTENSGENVNFQMFFKMVKSNEIPWKSFIQSMKYMITLLDLTKSKKLIFELLEEVKGFLEKETAYKDKQQQNRISELEKTNEILRKEIESLKEECEKFQGKLAAFSVSKDSHEELSRNFDDLPFGDDKELDTKVEIVTDIKIEEFNINENVKSVSNETMDNGKSHEEQNNGAMEESINLNPVSVRLICLSKSQIQHYSNVANEPNNAGKYCEICEKTFSSVSALKVHLGAVHEGQKKHECGKCDESFNQAGTLKLHNKSDHKNLKKYKCNKCGKSFTRTATLKKHKKVVHEGVKKFKCNKCGKSFGYAGHLKTHTETIHEGLKRFKCNKCGESFGESGKLKRHNETVHEGLKKYRCDKCGKSFSQASHLKTHNETVHEGLKKYKCEKCNKYFTANSGLKYHMQVTHEDLKKTNQSRS